MPVAADYPFLDILGSMLIFFGFVIWIWLLFTIFADLFRRHDISGWGKAGWTLLVIVLPLLGVLIYLGTQGKEMAERRVQEQAAAKAQLDDYVRGVAGSGDGAAAEIARAKELLDSGAISQAEYDAIKAKALA
jgi:Short C-terminal domain/Phospholipase_D-nuclease N-terminal